MWPCSRRSRERSERESVTSGANSGEDARRKHRRGTQRATRSIVQASEVLWWSRKPPSAFRTAASAPSRDRRRRRNSQSPDPTDTDRRNELTTMIRMTPLVSERCRCRPLPVGIHSDGVHSSQYPIVSLIYQRSDAVRPRLLARRRPSADERPRDDDRRTALRERDPALLRVRDASPQAATRVASGRGGGSTGRAGRVPRGLTPRVKPVNTLDLPRYV